MCACEPDFTCARCAARERVGLDDDDFERWAEMLGGTREYEDVAVPALADFEANP